MQKVYDIGEIPFYYTILSTPFNPEDLPDKLSFTLMQDKNGIIVQQPSAKECAYLDLAYQKGSQISGLMDDKGIGKSYADDFIKFICENEKEISGKKVLEIGCGTGYLLYKLQKLGAEVLGIEPGAYGVEGRNKFGVPIIIDFFEAGKIVEKYDIVIFYGVLEHMQEADKFLADVKSILKTDGKIFLAVPDCEPYISVGDISLLMHEHWNYFTKDTLKALMINSGLCGSITRSEFAGALYGFVKRGEGEEVTLINENILTDYIQKVESTKRKIVQYLDTVLSEQSLGIYVPGRMINLLSICYEKIPAGIRFFDDNESFHKKFFPGIDVEIENFEELVNDPVDVMIISSFTFGNKIKEKILTNGVKCKVILLEELFV